MVAAAPQDGQRMDCMVIDRETGRQGNKADRQRFRFTERVKGLDGAGRERSSSANLAA
jgi:hypothetical protein